MAKHTLILEEDLHFDLIGVCCHLRDYRVCWLLNQQIKTDLKKSEEPFMISGKKGEVLSAHSLYEWFDEENEVNYYFIQNKSNGKYLLPELPEVDFLLAVKESDIVNIDDLLNKIKAIDEIIAAINIDVYKLKSAKRLIF